MTYFSLAEYRCKTCNFCGDFGRLTESPLQFSPNKMLVIVVLSLS